MARLTPQEYQEKQARRLSGATEDVRKGIARVTVNPCDLAAAQKDKMLARLTESVQNGKWVAGLKRVTLEQWKAQATNVGVGRIASGIAAAKEKVIAFAEQLLPHIDKVQASIKSMPSITLEDNINRMTTFVRGMADFKRTR